MVALDEDRAVPSGGDRAGQDGGGVVDRALEGVGLLAARQLQDHCADIGCLGGLVGRPRHVEGLGSKIDRRNREPGDLAAGSRVVEPLDARRAGTQDLAGLPDQELGGLDSGLVQGKGSGPGDVPDSAVPKRDRVVDDQPIAIEMRTAFEAGKQIGWGCRDVWHRVRLSSRRSGAHGNGPPTLRKSPSAHLRMSV